MPPLRKGGKYLPGPVPGCGAGQPVRLRVQQLQQMARGEIQAPKVSYQGLKVYQPTSQGWPLGATLLLENPNNQALNLLGYDYQLWIEGKSVAQGASQQPVNLPPNGQTVAELPIMVQLPAVMELLPQFLPQFLGQQQQQTAAAQIPLSNRRQLPSGFGAGWDYSPPLPVPGGGLPQGGHGFPEALPALTLRLGRNH